MLQLVCASLVDPRTSRLSALDCHDSSIDHSANPFQALVTAKPNFNRNVHDPREVNPSHHSVIISSSLAKHTSL